MLKEIIKKHTFKKLLKWRLVFCLTASWWSCVSQHESPEEKSNQGDRLIAMERTNPCVKPVLQFAGESRRSEL